MRERGIVEVFGDLGYGFVRPLAGGRNVFCHQSNIQMPGLRRLHAGDLVEFETGPGRNGRVQAVRVKLIQPAEPALV